MTDRMTDTARPVRVPSGRFTRSARLAALAGGIAGAAALRGARGAVGGNRPEWRDLLITPANLQRLTGELAHMRGAAMKVGQLLSMDAGEVLPPELSGILSRLRDDAHFMPPRQLKQVLNANWGASWLQAVDSFDVRPVAAASIGQVHRLRLRDGRDLAVKVQYPGIARSIDSDVANVGTLVRLSGLLPGDFDLAPYLEEARALLHEETDYLREGRNLQGFKARLADDDRFVLPDYHVDWSTGQVLAMSFMQGDPIETVETLDAPARDRIATDLVDLMLRELFEFGEMQSDPNFANFRFDPESRRIVLLDFGATRRFDTKLVGQYRDLLSAGMAGDGTALQRAATSIGFLQPDGNRAHQRRLIDMIETVFAAIRAAPNFDFADTDLSRRLQAEGMALAGDGFVPPPLPMDVLYLQRKFGGLFLLANRLKARVPVAALIDKSV